MLVFIREDVFVLFKYGDHVILRYVSPDNGEKFDRAQIGYVVEDSEARTVLYISSGSGYRQPERMRKDKLGSDSFGDFTDRTWKNWSTVRVMFPGVPYSVWAMYAAQSGEFTRWYVNIEEPFKRTPIGFDVIDFELDMLVAPDLTWTWKDEDHLANMVQYGIFTAAQAVDFKLYGLDAIGRIERLAPPFNEPWPQWRPDPEWGPLKMPDDDSAWLNLAVK